ncbi:MAG TPA: SOS response-associated peptidase [Gemmataceae bacterium]|nr:SOS response-associated peptidase [Gemmataceae bacterium]
MCGRFTLTTTPQALNQLFPLFDGIDLPPNYNVAPTQNVLAVRVKPGTDQLEAVRLRWGLVPSWADDIKIGYKLINARLDTAATKPSFRSAFKQRHCLILADGFFEWKKIGKTKQPFLVRMRDGQPFAFAGLWEKWDGGEKPVESCTILTTDANELMREVHDRMPVIVDKAHLRHWLVTPGASEPGTFAYLGPFPADAMTKMAVNPLVNNVRNNDPRCLEPAAS